MRVITGKYRGKRLASPESDSVRPTTDRIKETMFNMLASRGYADGIKVLDLFAGSGALGIEALSRGALSCVFVDKDRKSVDLVKLNLKNVGASAEVYNADYSVAISRLVGKKFDLIILDPPYKECIENKVISLIEEYDILEDDGIILIEHAKENIIKNISDSLYTESRSCGSSAITFVRKNL